MFNTISEIVGEGNMLRNEPMSKHTSFKIGGIAKVFVTPKSTSSLFELIHFLYNNMVPYFIVGNGSNLLVGDMGINGIVIKTANYLDGIRYENEHIVAESGVTLPRLSAYAAKLGFEGLEFCSGIPGTLGGAIVMNAGAYGSEIKDIIASTIYLDEYARRKEIGTAEHKFSYRSSMFTKMNVILSARIRIKLGNSDDIRSRIKRFSQIRSSTQPVNAVTAGSAFKKVKVDGEFVSAARFIEKAGLKGFRIGDAAISEKHCGFIVNEGRATAADVLKLVNHIKQAVLDFCDIKLESEIECMGEFE